MRFLYVSHAFPPQAGGGIRRITNSVLLLAKMGTSVTVLTRRLSETLSHLAGIPFDRGPLESLANQASISICSAPSLESRFYSLKRGKSRPAILSQAKTKRSWKDTAYLWAPFAILCGLFKKFDLIFATGPSFANFVVAWILATIRNKPLIVEYRDGWLLDPSIETDALQTKVISTIEKCILDRSTCVISTTQGISDLLSTYYNIPSEKFLLVRNGFTSETWNPKSSIKFADPGFHVAHVGTLSTGRSAEDIIRAVADLKTWDGREIFLHFIGTTSSDEAQIAKIATEHNLEERVKCWGFVSRKESLEFMHAADALLLMINTNLEDPRGFGVPGKLGDYVKMNANILTSTSAFNFLSMEFNNATATPSPLAGHVLINIPNESLDFDKNFSDVLSRITLGS